MFHFATFLVSVLGIYSSVWPSAVQAKMLADCTFDGMANTAGELEALAFTAKLGPYKNLSHSCVVKTSKRNHFLHAKAKRNKQSEGKKKISLQWT